MKIKFQYSIMFVLICLVLYSCSGKYVQLFKTSTTNTKLINDKFVYENDTLKIEYFFWEQKGVMSFEITNKFGLPIYIDWKNSSFIVNDQKLNYWEDATISKSRGFICVSKPSTS